MKLYLAGPLFSTAERTFNTQLRDLLIAAGHEVWLPQDKEPREATAKAIFLMDVDGIDWCDVVVACMDGPDPDSGTCWECGYAYRKKKIICYRTDFRSATEHAAVGQDMDAPVKGLAPFNLMLSESSDRLVLSPFATLADLASNLCYALDCIKEPCWMCNGDKNKVFAEMAAYEYALHNRRVVCPIDLRCHKCRRVVHYETEPIKNETEGHSIIECVECPKPAVWVRHTQFAGDHPFCDGCAKKEADFGKSDPSYFGWERIDVPIHHCPECDLENASEQEA